MVVESTLEGDLNDKHSSYNREFTYNTWQCP
jgi:hypothetical protein